MRTSFIAGPVIAFALCAAAPAFAADNGIYLGGSVGESSVSFDETVAGETFSFDADSTGYKAIAGWRILDGFAVEANYVDLGSGDDQVAGQKFETGVDGVSLSAIGFLTIGPVDVFARVGGINWNADVKA